MELGPGDWIFLAGLVVFLGLGVIGGKMYGYMLLGIVASSAVVTLASVAALIVR